MAPPDPSVTRIDGPWRHLDVHANGIRFHVVEAISDDQDTTAPTAQPLVIMLHGFGSFWWSWRHQLRGLTGARVVAVDLRGYGGSDKPPRGYDLVTAASLDAGLPTFSPLEAAVRRSNALFGLVSTESGVGRMAASKALDILSRRVPAASEPVGSLPSFSLLVDMSTARQLRSYPPLRLLEVADVLGAE